MNWTNYAGDRTGMENLYNSSTYLKQRYTYRYDGAYEWAAVFTSTLNQIRNNFRSSWTYGLYDNKVTGIIVPIGVSIDFAEAVGVNSVEVYAFRDNTTQSHYIINAFGENDGGTLFCIHSGVDTNGSAILAINSDKTNNVLDLLTFTTANQALNSVRGTNYILQPLCVYDEKTPFYIVSGNSNLAAFATITVDNKIFMSIGNGICVEVNEEG